MKNKNKIDDLAVKAVAGDKNSEKEIFSFLYARFSVIVQHTIYNSFKDPAEIKKDVEDIIQETMIVIFQRYKNINYSEGFSSWALGVLRNKIGDFFRKEKNISQKAAVSENLEIKDEKNLEDEIEGDDLEYNIKKAIINMNSNYQTIIIHLLQGDSVKDLLKIFTNIPRGTFDNILYRCREKLKLILEENECL